MQGGSAKRMRLGGGGGEEGGWPRRGGAGDLQIHSQKLYLYAAEDRLLTLDLMCKDIAATYCYFFLL